MTRSIITTCLCIFFAFAGAAYAQPGGKNNAFYGALGTNLSWYSKSDLHIKQAPGLTDFTLYDVKGRDDGGFRTGGEAPQYSLQIGYYNHQKKWGIEFNFDHIKYYVRQGQRVKVKGILQNSYRDEVIFITPELLQLEHSDGANYALLKLTKWIAIAGNARGVPLLELAGKAGGGLVIPKTKSIILGRHRDDRYHIAGYVFAVETGLRYHPFRFIFCEANVKGTYANLKDILIAGGRARQQWYALHASLLMGWQF